MKVGYVGSHATHQDMYTADANTPLRLIDSQDTLIFPCATEGTKNAAGQYVTCKSAGPKRNLTFGALLASGWFASSNYNGLLLEVKQRLKSFTVGTNGALVTSTAQTSAGRLTSAEIPRQIQLSAKVIV